MTKQKVEDWLKQWLTVLVIIIGFIVQLSVMSWYASRYTYKIEQHIINSTETFDEMECDVNVIVDFMEDSLGYNHKHAKENYYYKQNWKDYQKKKGIRSIKVDPVIIVKKLPD